MLVLEPDAQSAAAFRAQDWAAWRRSGRLTYLSAPDYAGVAKRVMRFDIYEEAMKELGVTHGGMNEEPEALFDGVTFNPKDPETYAKSFAIHNLAS